MAVASSYAPDEAYNLKSEVSAGKNIEISHGNMQFKARFDDVVVPFRSLISKYYHALREYIVEQEYTDEEFQRYYQRPKLLSSDLYGTPELWSWLLYINNCKTIANFTNPKVKIFTSDIKDAINEILTICNKDLKTNRSEVYTED